MESKHKTFFKKQMINMWKHLLFQYTQAKKNDVKDI